MNPETHPDFASVEASSPHLSERSAFESAAFYVFLATVILTPLAFLPTPYVAIELAKTMVIAVGSLASAMLYLFAALKEKRLTLPPRRYLTIGLLLVGSFLVSALTSTHISKSLFGQGFELGTASFTGILFIVALVAFLVSYRQAGKVKVIMLYAGLAASFAVLFLLHLLRFAFGASFLSFSIMSSKVATIFGNWNDLGVFALAIALMSLSALIFLPLSKRMKSGYWILAAASFIGAAAINNVLGWWAALAASLALAAIFFPGALRSARESGRPRSSIIAAGWICLLAVIVAAVFAWMGIAILSPFVNAIGGQYSSVVLPWQITIDVIAGAIKNYPWFGVGPNHFLQAFIAYRPPVLNSTPLWSVEFTNGFGLLPSWIALLGSVGTVLWVVFFVSYAGLGRLIARALPADPFKRFLLASSYSVSVLVWVSMIISVPSHALLFVGYLMTGIAVGTASASGILKPVIAAERPEARYSFYAIGVSLCLAVVLVWGLTHVKKAAGLAYFGSGVKSLSAGDTDAAAARFAAAERIDSSDVYLQAHAEALLSGANALAGRLSGAQSASSSQEIISAVGSSINQALDDSHRAEAFDPGNYYNFISEARVSEAASALKMENSYDNAVAAYVKAINLNPLNPSLYVNLARFQFTSAKYDDALQVLGRALQVKNDYIDAVFLLSQVQAARGNIADAITAAKVATQISPERPLLYFQLGVLDYNAARYDDAAAALASAVKLQPDYANAKYFLGLSYARLNKASEAVAVFTDLSAAYPDNAEVASILAALRSGRSIFVPVTPATPAPAAPAQSKRTTLPVKEKQQ